MIAYLDTSVVVSMFLDDVHTSRVRAWLAQAPMVRLSDWTVTEFSSALSAHQRQGRLGRSERANVEEVFDSWLSQSTVDAVTTPDFLMARQLLRAHAQLRGPDALHLSFARSRDWQLATLDAALSKVAAAERVTTSTL